MRVNILLIFAGILVGLCAGEISLRAASFIIKHGRHDSYSGIDRSALTVLCVGDSVTYGFGDKAGEGYPAKLGVILAKKLGRKVIVINKGIPGASTAVVLRELKNAVKTIPRIDLVVILTGNGNSLWNFKEMYREIAKFRVNFESGMFLKIDHFFSNLRLYSLVKSISEETLYEETIGADDTCQICLDEAAAGRNVLKYDVCETGQFDRILSAYHHCLRLSRHCRRATLGILDMYAFCGKDLTDDSGGIPVDGGPYIGTLLRDLKVRNLKELIFKVMHKNVAEMIRLCDENKIRVLLISDYPSGRPIINFTGYAQEDNVSLLGLNDYFKDDLNCTLCKKYFFDEAHPNTEGYYLMAGRIADKILNMIQKGQLAGMGYSR